MAAFTYEQEFSSVTTGPWVVVDPYPTYTSPAEIKAKAQFVTITLIADPGVSAYVETTTESVKKVYEDPSRLHPIMWPPRLVVGSSVEYTMFAPTAFRVIVTTPGNVFVSARGI